MSMVQYGYVTSVSGNRVKVSVVRESACGGNCVSCKGCPSDTVVIDYIADDNKSFKIGDYVKIEMPTASFFKGAFGGYILSSVLMLLFAVLGYWFFKSEGMSVIAGILGLIFGLVCVKLIFGKENSLKVTKVIKTETEEDIYG